MAESNQKPADQPIDVNDKAACESWVHKLNVTHEQLRKAVDAVGSNSTDVEKHLKGTGGPGQVPRAPHADKPSGS